jgi:hypothetical protein
MGCLGYPRTCDLRFPANAGRGRDALAPTTRQSSEGRIAVAHTEDAERLK